MAFLFGLLAPAAVGVICLEVIQFWPLLTADGFPASATSPAAPPNDRTVPC